MRRMRRYGGLLTKRMWPLPNSLKAFLNSCCDSMLPLGFVTARLGHRIHQMFNRKEAKENVGVGESEWKTQYQRKHA